MPRAVCSTITRNNQPTFILQSIEQNLLMMLVHTTHSWNKIGALMVEITYSSTVKCGKMQSALVLQHTVLQLMLEHFLQACPR